ncbi:AraC family transcriptional regulator [Flavihumibacter sediminis]|nr:AraC family transcriptional regulator [Flavihumibacter sediminis]
MIPDFIHWLFGKLLFGYVDPRQYRGPRIAGSDFQSTSTLPGKCLIQHKQNPRYGISYRVIAFQSTVKIKVREHSPGIRMELILSGQLDLQRTDGSITRLGKGDYFFTSLEEYSLHTISKERAVTMVLYIHQLASGLTDNQITLVDNQTYLISDEMKQRVDEMIYHSFNDRMLDEFYEGNIREIFFIHFQQNADRFSGIKQHTHLKQIILAHSYITEDITRSISIPQLSRMAALNDYTLKKEFRRYYNTSIYDQLVDKRINYSKILLVNSEDGLIFIAQKVGYKSVSSFAKAFRRKVGIPPEQFRTLHKK